MKGVRYFIGLMIIIFLLLGSIGFTRKYTINEYNKLLDECNEDVLVYIPDVSNLSIDEAKSKLLKEGFNVSCGEEDYLYEVSDEIRIGNVIRTNPSFDTLVDSGVSVCLVVSNGNSSFTLDNYIGKDYRDVQSVLKAKYKCNVRVEKKIAVGKNENEVLSVSVVDGNQEKDVSSGDVIKNGSTIVLYIPSFDNVYPDFTSGYSLEEVREFADKYNLLLVVNYEVNSVLPEGTILRQDRAQGSTIVESVKLNITVSKKS